MHYQNKVASGVQFFLGCTILFGGMTDLVDALSYNGLENNFLAENWGIALVFFLTLIFALGWGIESIVEKLVLFKGRIAILSLVIIILAFIILTLGSSALIPRGFWQSAMSSIGHFLMSGCFFRLSAIRPEVMAKLQIHS